MKRARLGLDLDGVCYRYQDTFAFLAEHYLGVKIDLSKWTHWNYPDSLLSPGQIQWMWTKGVELGLFRNGSLYKGTAEAVRRLGELTDLVVITSRPKNAIQDTIDWLSYQRFPLTELHIVGDQPKSEIVCDVYIDDAIHNAIELSKLRVPILLWDRPWNQERIAVPHTFRIRSWGEALEWVERIANRVRERN